MEKGFSKNVAQKALLFNQGATVNVVLEWIELHKNDVDFDKELVIIS